MSSDLRYLVYTAMLSAALWIPLITSQVKITQLSPALISTCKYETSSPRAPNILSNLPPDTSA